MHELIHAGTRELSRFLEAELPRLSPQWWQRNVVERLTFQQQRIAQEKRFNCLQQLDFASLLRVFDQNWNELSGLTDLPREGRSWLKELQTVRNKWAHLSAESISPDDMYRDVDTLGRLLGVVKASPASLALVEAAKAKCVVTMAGGTRAPVAAPLEDPSRGHDEPAAIASRTTYSVGDLVRLRSDHTVVMPIIEVLSGSGECRYRVFHGGSRPTYYESQLEPAETEPSTSVLVSAAQLHAYLTSVHILSPSTASLYSLRSGRVQFVPYQYRPVLKLIRSDRPRLLIADEVGVGKTIEAGLIIKELRARMDLGSVLVICPKALVAERKWELEMRRFDERFTPLDGRLLKHCLQETHLEGEWPEQYCRAIIPFSLFDADLVYGGDAQNAGKRGLVSLDPAPKFDLVIVDEAHHIRNSETYLHQGIKYFCDNAQAVLFLTATPVQLGSEDLYTLLNVLRPDLVIDHASFQQMAEPNHGVNEAVRHARAACDGWQQEARAQLGRVAETSWGKVFLQEDPTFQGICDRLQTDPVSDTERVGLIRDIEALYTFGPLISRTRRRDIGEFTTRKPETVSIEFTPPQQGLHDDLLDVVARILVFCHGQQNVKFMMTTLRRQAASCLYGLAPLLNEMLTGKLDQLEFMETSDNDESPDLGFVSGVRSDIESLLLRANSLDGNDPKVTAFIHVLKDKATLPNNKALVFSTFRHTLGYLAQHTAQAGLRYGLVHGGVPDDERAELRRRFAKPKEDSDAIDVLLSSEVGCEGLDFQFCDFLINYDLPWNPMRIEQRIGRIDRYGQRSEAIAIINFITPGTVDADIYDRCLWRIGVFQHAIGGNEEILGEVTAQLHRIGEQLSLSPEERERVLRQIADNGIRRIHEDEMLESRQRELFGLSVPTQAWQQEVEAAQSFWLAAAAIEKCVMSYLTSRLGAGEYLLGEKSLKTLRLNQEARAKLLEDYRQLPRSTESVNRDWEKWLKGGLPTLAVTFDQETATANAKAVHLSVTHPLVRQAARSHQPDEPVQVSLQVCNSAAAKGIHSFALYRWRRQGVRPDEIVVAVAADAGIEAMLLKLLQTAVDSDTKRSLGREQLEQLESRHHTKWTSAQADHIAGNRQLVEHRVQSLKASHQARYRAIEYQIAQATNDRIRIMKESELARARGDFDRRMIELQQASSSGDIHAAAILFGTIEVNPQ